MLSRNTLKLLGPGSEARQSHDKVITPCSQVGVRAFVAQGVVSIFYDIGRAPDDLALQGVGIVGWS